MDYSPVPGLEGGTPPMQNEDGRICYEVHPTRDSSGLEAREVN